MPAFRMLTFYITMSTIIAHVDFLLIFMGFPRFCPHYLCYVDKSWTNCHLWTNLSFFLFLTIPYFIRVCEVIYHNSFCTFCHFHMAFCIGNFDSFWEHFVALFGYWMHLGASDSTKEFTLSVSKRYLNYCFNNFSQFLASFL